MRPNPDAPLGCFIAWFLLVALVSLAWIGALIWLVLAVVDYLGRH